jgi:O-antigen/teichoic acid export membrane protein
VYLARVGNLALAGQYALALAVAAPIFLFFSLGFRNARAAQGSRPLFGRYFVQLRVVGLFVSASLALSILLPIYWETRSAVMLILAVIFFKLVDGVSDLVYGEHQRTEAFNSLSVSLYVRSTIIVLGLFVGSFLRIEPQLVVLLVSAMSVCWTLLAHVGDLRAISSSQMVRPGEQKRREEVAAIRTIFVRHASLGASATMSSLGPNIPRYALALWIGPEAVAIFSLLLYFPLLAQLVVISMGQTQVGRLGNDFREDRQAFRKRTHMMIGGAGIVGTLLVLGGLFAGEFLLDLLYGKELSAYGNILVLLCAYGALAFVASVLHFAIIATGMYKSYFKIVGSGALLLLLLVTIAVPRIDIYGAAIAMIGGMIVQVIASYAVVTKESRA